MTRPTTKPLTGVTRGWLLLDTLLVLIAGIQLYVLSGHTDRFFAWTIAPPLTAAWLGANYLASIPLLLLSRRAGSWAAGRLSIFGVWVFTAVTLLVTLIHLDRFHLAAPGLAARIAAWGWLVVYVVVPPALLAVAALQTLRPGGDPPRAAPLPILARLAFAAAALALLLGGAALFVFPTLPLWPWMLTPLTGRAVAAWLLGLAVIAGHAALENDWARLRALMPAVTLLAALQLVALLRFVSTLAERPVLACLYALALAGVLGFGAYGWGETRRAPRSPA
jgi:hypothetical protein